MSDTPTPVQPRLAGNITVSRKPGQAEVDLFIDGQPFPWYFAGELGAEVKVTTERVPAVTITILAASVTVADEGIDPVLLASLAHSHDGEGDDDE